MSSARIPYWQNEDGEAWVEVADADQDTAGQYLADDFGMLVVTGDYERATVPLQDCECPSAPVDVCPDADPPGPCHVRLKVDCWVALVWYKLGASTVLAELADHVPDGQLAPLLRRMIPKLVEQVERP